MKWLVQNLIRLFLAFTLFLAGSVYAGQEGGSRPIITIGLVDTFAPEFYLETYAKTVDHLIEALPQYHIKVVEISPSNIRQDIDRYKPSFLVSSASVYVSLLEDEGAQQVATKEPKQTSDVLHTVSSTFIVPRSSQIKNVGETRGKVVAVSDRDSFDGWLIAKGEIAKFSKNPDKFFSSLIESKYQIPDVPMLVKMGLADVGVLGTCEYENLLKSGAINQGEFRVLDRKDDGRGCMRSTDQYPDVVFSSLPGVSSNITRDVTLALLNMPSKNNEFRWTIANNFVPTYELLRNIEAGPFKPEPLSLKLIWNKYRIEFVLALALGAALLLHILTVNLLVRRRTEQLSESLKNTKKFYEEAQESRQKLASLERFNIVSQLSSMFAHEIKQPITNLGYYAASLKMLLQKKNSLDEKSAEILSSIQEEVRKSADIVDHVRNYAKKRKTQAVECNLTDIVQRAISTFPKDIVRNEVHGIFEVFADPFELQFIVENFVKNSMAVIATVSHPEIRISVKDSGNNWILVVTDNGPALTDEQFERLGKVGQSTKQEGLGFGLVIAMAIAEANGGHIEFERRIEGGLKVYLFLQKYSRGSSDA